MQEEFPTWSFEIGDPSFMGVFTVICYFFTTLLCFLVFIKAEILFSKKYASKQKKFWLIFALVFLFLGINKQLDLQSYITTIAKYYAKKDGWYGIRRVYQKQFIVLIITVLSFSMCFLLYYFNKIIRSNLMAILGLFFLFSFIAIRASSFHKMDLLINYEILNLRLNWVFELTGIFLVFLCAKSKFLASD